MRDASVAWREDPAPCWTLDIALGSARARGGQDEDTTPCSRAGSQSKYYEVQEECQDDAESHGRKQRWRRRRRRAQDVPDGPLLWCRAVRPLPSVASVRPCVLDPNGRVRNARWDPGACALCPVPASSDLSRTRTDQSDPPPRGPRISRIQDPGSGSGSGSPDHQSPVTWHLEGLPGSPGYRPPRCLAPAQPPTHRLLELCRHPSPTSRAPSRRLDCMSGSRRLHWSPDAIMQMAISPVAGPSGTLHAAIARSRTAA